MTAEPDSLLEPMLRKLRLWAKLGVQDEQAILGLPHQMVTIPKQRAFILEGDVATHCWLLIRGFCVRYKVTLQGARQIVSLHMKGDLVDLQNVLLGEADHGVQALTECQLLKIPIAKIRALTRSHPNIIDALWYDTLVDGSVLREWVANVGRRPAKTKIAHLLCELALKLDAIEPGHPLTYKLPMTQDELADATGLTSVHVNRILKDLTRDGLIQRPTLRRIVISDWDRLTAVGDFDRRYLHLQGRA